MSDTNTPPVPRFHEVWQPNLRPTTPPRPWLWQGYLLPGSVTLLTSPWKSGKTTLTAALLARMGAGGPLASLAVRPGKALLVTEESREQWWQRSEHFAIGGHVCWLCRPFSGKPTPCDWLDLLDHIAALHRQHQFALLVIDPLAEFLPGRTENDAAGMLRALLPLRPLLAGGLAVLLLHHPRKQASAEGQAARGSGALSGHVDILIEMAYFAAPTDDDRRRKLRAYSRFEETPRRRVIELDAAGTDYINRGDFAEEEFGRSWPLLRDVLATAPRKLTRTEVHAAWPSDEEVPGEVTLWRWLERAVTDGRVQRDGRGSKGTPYRYWLAENVEGWQRDLCGEAQRQEDEDYLRQFLGEAE